MDTLQDGTSDFEPERPTHNNHGEESGSVIKKPATLLSSSNFKHQNSAGNHRSFWKTFLEGSTSFIRHTAFATYIKPVLADAGDDFSNNLLSDLAPVLALFGEQVAKQFMSQSMLWLDNVIFACAPLGIITAVVCAIRVGGPTWMKAVIGRAREGTGVVEVELMSSTSEDVCELWNRESIVRCLGTSPIIELYYLEPEDKQQYNSYKTSLGWCLARRIKIKLRSLYGWARDKGDSSYYADRHETGDSVPDDGIYDFKTARKHKMLRCYNPTIDTNTALSSTSKVAPNIAINLTGKHVSQWELAMVATIGILIQIGVLVFAGLSVLLDPFNNRFKKNEKPIEKHALPTMITGTVALVIGMYICSHVVERSTWEEKWNMVPPAGYRLKVAWVQKGGEVNDQLFESYFIPRATSPGSLDDSVPMIISRKKEKQSSQTSLTILAVFISMAGFIIQFVGLRGLNWSVAIAQLTATGIMTILRAILRRNMAYKIKDSIQITAGQELDMVAKNIKRCNHWNVIACGLDKEKANGPQSTPGTGTDGDTEAATPNLQEYTYTTKNLASKVYSSRYRLGILSKWESQWKDTVKNTTLAIETAMNFFCSGTNSDFKLEKNAKFKTERSENKATIEKFEWELIIESQSSEFSDRYIYETIVLTLTRKLLPGRGWSTWTADKKQIECVLGLWMHHLTNNAKDIPTTEPVDATSETEPFENSNRLFRMLGADGFSNNVYEQWICCQPKNVPERLHTTEQLQTIIARPTPKNYDIPESGILVVQLDVPLQNLCGQVLLSEFLRKVVACISIKVRNQMNLRTNSNERILCLQKRPIYT
ncbi:hypothetical protein EDC01DRAFT_64217 [Geopyxis carbonaria]|nr:hypothetical protein EDC01DRAFT_64217 [Geopyxis carbonaria]